MAVNWLRHQYPERNNYSLFFSFRETLFSSSWQVGTDSKSVHYSSGLFTRNLGFRLSIMVTNPKDVLLVIINNKQDKISSSKSEHVSKSNLYM